MAWERYIKVKRIKGREYVYVHWGSEGKRHTRYIGPANQPQTYTKAQKLIKQIMLNRLKSTIHILRELGVEVKIEDLHGETGSCDKIEP